LSPVYWLSTEETKSDTTKANNTKNNGKTHKANLNPKPAVNFKNCSRVCVSLCTEQT